MNAGRDKSEQPAPRIVWHVSGCAATAGYARTCACNHTRPSDATETPEPHPDPTETREDAREAHSDEERVESLWGEVQRLRLDISHRSQTVLWQQRRAEAAERALAVERARVARVEALASECERRAKAADRKRRRSAQRWAAEAIALRAALAEPATTEGA